VATCSFSRRSILSCVRADSLARRHSHRAPAQTAVANTERLASTAVTITTSCITPSLLRRSSACEEIDNADNSRRALCHGLFLNGVA
jgi:hypothetical protein